MRALRSLTYCIRASTVPGGAIGSTKEGGRSLGPEPQTCTSRGRRASPMGTRARASVAAAAALLVAAICAPSAGAQSGGALVPGAGGAPAPDLAPVAPAPEPDPAPGGDSDTESSPPPASAPPAATAPAPAPTPIVPASPSSQLAPEIRSSPPASPRTRKSTRGQKKKAARRSRTAGQAEQRARVTPPRRTWVFGESLPLSRLAGRGIDTESPPAQLLAFALLALVLAGASFLTLTARLSREWRV